MAQAPGKCPICGDILGWQLLDIERKGFSVGKAAIGIFALGSIGGVAGALGKKKRTYLCHKCGFRCEYDDVIPASLTAEEMFSGMLHRQRSSERYGINIRQILNFLGEGGTI
jgi:hypothetical protein